MGERSPETQTTASTEIFLSPRREPIGIQQEYNRSVLRLITVFILLRAAAFAHFVEASDATVSQRYRNAFRAIWEQPSEPMQGELLCLAVHLGTRGALTVEEVSSFKTSQRDATECRLKWLWAFGERRDSDTRKQLMAGFFPEDLLPYGLDSEERLSPEAINRLFSSYASDAGLDRFPQNRNEEFTRILNIWRLRRFCQTHPDFRCDQVASRVRKHLNRAFTSNSIPHDAERDIPFLWATVRNPEPGTILDWAKKNLSASPWNTDFEEVLESWKTPEAVGFAIRRSDVGVLFRLGKQVSEIKPLPIEVFNQRRYYSRCFATPPDADQSSLITAFPSIFLPFCATDPRLVARHLYWIKDGTTFDLSQDRDLLSFLVKVPQYRDHSMGYSGGFILTRLAIRGQGTWTSGDLSLLRSTITVLKASRAYEVDVAALNHVADSLANTPSETPGELAPDPDVAALFSSPGSLLLNGSPVEAKVENGRVTLLGEKPAAGLNIFQKGEQRLLAWYESRSLTAFEHPYKNSYAVIVAVDNYERKGDSRGRGPTGFGPLGQMVASAERLKAALVQRGFAPDHVLTFYNQGADSKAVNTALETFWAGGARADADRLFFYFGGHGSHVGDVGYLVTYDYDRQKPTLTSLLMRDLTGRHADNILAHHFLIALDACDSGLAVSTLGDPARERAERQHTRALRIIRNDTAPKARNVLLAGNADQDALYDNGGVFTQSLIRGLEGAGDLNQDGIIQFPELALYVRDEVADLTRGRVDQTVGYFKLPKTTGEVLFLKQGNR